jgi:endonuclease/exonuclease/phosphatase family metal-dependent hydrolase
MRGTARNTSSARAPVALLGCAALLALTLRAMAQDPIENVPTEPAEVPRPITLRVMTFNVWYGGEQVSLAKVGEAIRAAEADIVGVQEADENLDAIAAAAGMTFVDPRRRLISRWPIFDSGTGERTERDRAPYSVTALDRNAIHAWVMVQPGKVVAVANVHLSNEPSGIGLAREGRPLEEVLAAEQASRVVEVQPLAALGQLAAAGTPVFLTGDFNTPSHRDWTEAVRRARPEIPYAVDWPAMRLLEDAGLRDSFREAYPDAVSRPGFTWTPGTPHPVMPRGEGRDRIDYVLTAGRTETISSLIVGEQGGPDVDIAVSPWPSDHRALVSTFEVVPIDAPPMISVTPRKVTTGESFLVRTYDPFGEDWTALVVRRGAGPAAAITGVRKMPHSYQRTIPLSSHGLEPGYYDAILVGDEGEVLARDAFAVAARGARPEVAPVEGTVRVGAPIRVRWRNAPGDLRDWIGLYKAGETDVTQYLGFTYTDALFVGEKVVAPDEADRPWPPGDYELRLMHDETYVELASARIKIAP